MIIYDQLKIKFIAFMFDSNQFSPGFRWTNNHGKISNNYKMYTFNEIPNVI
jgi:hypothetical protein